MHIRSRKLEYHDSGNVFEGVLFWDDERSDPRPTILVAHTIRGRTAFEEEKARALAELGYCAFAADVYGKSEVGREDRGRQNMEALTSDRPLLQRRLHAALSTLSEQPEADAARLAAIGFCFGGLCVLDMVRSGAPLQGVASFHGVLSAPGNTKDNTSAASVLVLHGWDDPLATPDAVVALAEELSALGCDWQIHGYGNTVHAFTNPAAADHDRGTVYQPLADRRSWQSLQNFLDELFNPQSQA